MLVCTVHFLLVIINFHYYNNGNFERKEKLIPQGFYPNKQVICAQFLPRYPLLVVISVGKAFTK